MDALSDGTDVVIGGIMQHIEDAGVHSGDSACVLPPYLLGRAELDEMRRLTRSFALELGVVGFAERAVRRQGRAGVRPGGEPAGVAHRAVRGQGHRSAAGAPGRAADGGGEAGRPECAVRAGGERGRGQGGGLPLQPLRRGHPAGAGDALDGRGHGGGRLLRHGLRQGAGIGRQPGCPERATPGR